MAFKMKGNPMKRNFGVGSSPTKQANKEPVPTASEGALAKDVETESEKIWRGFSELGDVTDVLRKRKFRRDRLNLDKDGRKLTPGTAKKAISGAMGKVAKKASPNKLARLSNAPDYTPGIVDEFYGKLGKKLEKGLTAGAKGAKKVYNVIKKTGSKVLSTGVTNTKEKSRKKRK
tara:strand:- start:52 stop:573 length:522 start_codon:yes stop_codon:yes gene_type:complete